MNDFAEFAPYIYAWVIGIGVCLFFVLTSGRNHL